MAQILSKLFTLIKSVAGALVTVFGAGAVSYTIGTLVTLSFVAIWITVLEYSFSYLSDALINAVGIGEIFGSLPAGAVYLITAAFPLQLFFSLTVTYLVFEVSVDKLLVIAIAASRQLKGK